MRVKKIMELRGQCIEKIHSMSKNGEEKNKNIKGEYKNALMLF